MVSDGDPVGILHGSIGNLIAIIFRTVIGSSGFMRRDSGS